MGTDIGEGLKSEFENSQQRVGQRCIGTAIMTEMEAIYFNCNSFPIKIML